MRALVELELTASRSALARVIACLHSRGLRIEHANFDGRTCSITVAGPMRQERLKALMSRSIDVLAVRCVELAEPLRVEIRADDPMGRQAPDRQAQRADCAP
jgi:acetolactate synthase regulatory subunit